MTMQTTVTVLGLDPGPRPGIVGLTITDGQLVRVRVAPPEAGPVPGMIAAADLVAVERFMVGPGTARKTRGATGLTMAQAEAWADAARRYGRKLQYLPAGSVKPWATDHKLKVWGLYAVTAGAGGHARDAARHALFYAVRAGALPIYPADYDGT